MNKPYFTKYLPVEGEIKLNDPFILVDTIYRKLKDEQLVPGCSLVKLFICSRDIQVGDVLQAVDGSGSYSITEFTRTGTNGKTTDLTGNVADGSVLFHQLESDYLKIIGEILTPNIKEGQEFTEKEIEYLTLN